MRLLRLDILDESPTHVVALASDALAAAYGGRRLADDVRRLLRTPWIAAARRLPPIPADLGPFGADLHDDFGPRGDTVQGRGGRARRGDRCGRGRVEPPHARGRLGRYLSGRLRPAAAAQFQAVRALRIAGVDAALAARGVWNAVSGCLQAVGVHDLLDEVTYGVLVAPWETRGRDSRLTQISARPSVLAISCRWVTAGS